MVLAFAILLLSASHCWGMRTKIDRIKIAAETLAAAAADSLTSAEAEIEEMQKKDQDMKEETVKLKEPTDSVEESGDGADRENIDKRSAYVGNVYFRRKTTKEEKRQELQDHFNSCGQINRITIARGTEESPRGSAFIEFADVQSFQNALRLNGFPFRGRRLEVIQKRTNIPARKG